LGVDVGLSEDVVLWKEFLRSLQERGRRDVKLETSDAHRGLKQAIAEVLESTRVFHLPGRTPVNVASLASPLSESLGEQVHPLRGPAPPSYASLRRSCGL